MSFKKNKINFLLNQCTFLRYYMPLVEEANKRGISSTFFIEKSGKYNCPQLKQNMDTIISLAKQHNIALKNMNESVSVTEEIFFTIEGCKLPGKNLKQFNKVYSLSYMTDFINLHENYIDLVDYSIFPSFKFAEYYNKLSQKNLYLGSPKYDIVLNKEEILNKYNLSDVNKKFALVVFPKLRDLHQVNMKLIYYLLNSLGFEVIVKTRGKDPIPLSMQNDNVYSDFSWYPHSTMELIFLSDIVINFSSTVVKECVMMKTPLINIHIKPFTPHLEFLYDYEYCKKLHANSQAEDFLLAVKELTTKDYTSEFNASIKENLFEAQGTCERIFQHISSIKN